MAKCTFPQPPVPQAALTSAHLPSPTVLLPTSPQQGRSTARTDHGDERSDLSSAPMRCTALHTVSSLWTPPCPCVRNRDDDDTM